MKNLVKLMLVFGSICLLTSSVIAQEGKERAVLLFFNQPAYVSMNRNDMFEKIIRDGKTLVVITVPLSKNEQTNIPYSLFFKYPDGRVATSTSMIRIKGGMSKTVNYKPPILSAGS